MPLHLRFDRDSPVPLYRQIIGGIRQQIAEGALPQGTRLPTVRQLAQTLGTTALTVQTAYSELRAEGWLEATVGRGTFVRAAARPADLVARVGKDLSPDGVLTDESRIQEVMGLSSLASSDPDPTSYPVDAFQGALLEATRAGALLAYGPAEGDRRLRVALSEYVRARGVQATPDDLLVTRGVTHALSLLTQTLTQPGDCVLVASPTYLGFLNTLQALRVEPLGVPVDDEGLDLEHLERLLNRRRPRFLYLVPTYHNPTGNSLSPRRRQALLELTGRYGLPIIEDDIYGRLPLSEPAPPPLLRDAAPGGVIYTDAFSKVLMPALRLGFVIAPPALRARLRFLRQAEDLCGSAFTERALALFLERGHLKAHLDRILPRLKTKRDTLLGALKRFMPAGVRWTVPQGGFNLWVTLPEGGAFDDLYGEALRCGVAFAPGEAFLTTPSAHRHFRLCFGMLPPEALEGGVKVIAPLIEARLTPPARKGVVR